jgi:CBS domain containing-hemolysin-like protein
MDVWLAALALLVLAALGTGAMASGVRRELGLLARRAPSGEDYALIALLNRLRDDPVSLALRLRLSRSAAVVFSAAGLAALGYRLSPVWAAVLAVAGWVVVLGIETGGLRGLDGLGRWRGAAGYAVWARLTQPGARLVEPLVHARRPRPPAERARARVLAEASASLVTGGGGLGRSEMRFLRRLLASTNILVADILTRWESVHRVDAAATVAEAARIAHDCGHSRLPVADGERVAGLVTAKDLLPRLHGPRGGAEPVRDLMRPVYFVRREETVKDLLEELQEGRTHLAVVVDRFGRPVGIVTMEDVLEEIVGELHDEREREGRRS